MLVLYILAVHFLFAKMRKSKNSYERAAAALVYDKDAQKNKNKKVEHVTSPENIEMMTLGCFEKWKYYLPMKYRSEYMHGANGFCAF